MGHRDRMRLIRKSVFAGFLLLFGVLMAYALFGEQGILANLGVQAEHMRLLDERERLRMENARLMAEIQALRSNRRKIEEISRRDFGFGQETGMIRCMEVSTGMSFMAAMAMT